MRGLTLRELKACMINYDEIEFKYQGKEYGFQKDDVPNSSTKIILSVWCSGENPYCCYSTEVEDSRPKLKKAVELLLKTNIFEDGKSLTTGEKNVEVIFYT